MNHWKRAIFTGVVGALVVGFAHVGAGQQTRSAVARPDDSALKSQIADALKANSSLAARDLDVDVKSRVATLTGTVRTEEERARAGRLAKVSGVTRVTNNIQIDPKIDESKIDAAGEKTKTGLNKAVDATVNAAHKTKEAVQKGVSKSEEGVGKAADKTADAADSVGDKLSDAAVTTRVKADLSDEQQLHDSSIDVETTDHVVTLRGAVSSNAARAKAGDIARQAEGVTRVVNEIVVKQE